MLDLPRLPLPGAVGHDSHFFETKIYNRVIARLEQRLRVLLPPVTRWREGGYEVAQHEQAMYALLQHPVASPLDKFEAILRFGFAYERYASQEGDASARHIGNDVFRELSLTF